MISQEARDLFAANVKAMTAGDAAHLASQLLPDDVSRLKDIAYVHDGDAAHLLDIYTPADAEEGAALPVIVDFHGGGLYYGNKENNECRDMLLARQGFAVVNANYRLVPSVSFPAQLADAMAVLDWIRDHGAEYGLDAERVCVTGDSAGGALALYLCAANGSTQLAGTLGLWQSGIEVHALVVTSGMFRLQGARQCAELLHGGLPADARRPHQGQPLSRSGQAHRGRRCAADLHDHQRGGFHRRQHLRTGTHSARPA